MNRRQVKDNIKKIVPKSIIFNIHRMANRSQIEWYSKIHTIPFSASAFPKGINLVGYFRQESGLGQSCRLLAKEIKASGIPYTFIDVNPSGIAGGDNTFENELSTEYKYSINLLSINMGDFLEFIKSTPKSIWNNHYNIAFWLWEVSEFPKEWIPYINRLDEIWTPSEFTSAAIRRVTRKPVFTIPYAMEAPFENKYDRKYFSLPDDTFLFLMLYDSYSISERKNPMGVIQAFKSAFRPTDNVGLVIKINHADDIEKEKLREEISGYHVYFVDAKMTKIEVNSLLRNVNVYVSLHRGEGFGLVLAEAMILGTPTIATNYSANAEFQNQDSACLVDYILTNVGRNVWPYKKEYIWADPDLKQASNYMKLLYNDPAYYERIKLNAVEHVNSVLSMDRAKDLIEKRVSKIYANT
jgi:glycosyltransferase involved in cell wall biosynthesis